MTPARKPSIIRSSKLKKWSSSDVEVHKVSYMWMSSVLDDTAQMEGNMYGNREHNAMLAVVIVQSDPAFTAQTEVL